MNKSLMVFLMAGLLLLGSGCSQTKTGAVQSTTPVTSVTPTQENNDNQEKSKDIEGDKVKNDNYFLKVDGWRPFGIAFDDSGTMYMITAPERGNGMLSKVTTDGKVEKIMDLVGTFMGPGIDIDKDNNLYIVTGDKLIKVTPDGITDVLADGFSRSIDVKVDQNGNVYVVDDIKDTIYMVTPNKEKSIVYEGKQAGSFILTSLSFDKEQKNLYATERGSLLKFAKNDDGTLNEPEVIKEKIPNLFYVGLDANNVIYFCDYTGFKRIESDGSITDVFKPLPSGISFKWGRKGFDENSAYITVIGGIMKVETE